eukprot:m51a1_g11276 hypothetical protein (743) ;mRNA; f:7210-9629
MPARSGRSCVFEGPGSLVSSAPYAHPISELSAAWWFRPDVSWRDVFPALTYRNATHDFLTFASEHVAWVYLLKEDARTRYGTPEAFVPSAGVWRHAAFTWDSSDGSVAFYADGAPAGRNATSRGLVLPAGGRFDFPDTVWGQRHFGHVDEVAAWSVALTPGDVAQLAAGSTRVRPQDRVLHWSCDDGSATEVADDAAGQPARPWASFAGSLKAPSTCPLVDVGLSVLRVRRQPRSRTDLGLPAGTRVLSLPSLGALETSSGSAVGAGDAPESVVYVAPDEGLVRETAFNTSYAAVVLAPNHAPLPRSRNATVHDYGRAVLRAALFDKDAGPTATDLVQEDGDGDVLAVWVTRLPQAGSLRQYLNETHLGEPIASVPALLADPLMRYVYVAAPGTAGSVVSCCLLRCPRPPTPANVSAVVGPSGTVAIDLPVLYAYGGQESLFVSAPARGALLGGEGGGAELVARTRAVDVHQFAAEVVDFSSEWDNMFAAREVLGAPSVYPAYGNIPGAWAFGDTSNRTEWVHLRFDRAVVVTGLTVYETYDGQSVVAVRQLAANGRDWETLFSRAGRTGPAPREAVAFAPPIAQVAEPHAVRDIRVEFRYVLGEWPEIDAVALRGTAQMALAEVPRSRRVVYRAQRRPGTGADSFRVLSAATPELLDRLAYNYFTPAEATVTVSIPDLPDDSSATAGTRDCSQCPSGRGHSCHSGACTCSDGSPCLQSVQSGARTLSIPLAMCAAVLAAAH